MLSCVSKLFRHHFFKVTLPLEADWLVFKLMRLTNKPVRSIAECPTFILIQLTATNACLSFVSLVPGKFKGFELRTLM